MTAVVEERPSDVAETPTEAEKEIATPAPRKKQATAEVEEYATFDDLLNKPARERDVPIVVNGKTLKIHLRAIGHEAYDELVASSPPSKDEQEKGFVFNQKAFQPKLVSAVVTRPKMDLDRASRLMADPNWSGGEWGGLYAACVEICQTGINVPFSGGG